VAQPELATWRASFSVHAALIARIEKDLKAHGLPPLSWYYVLWPLHRIEGQRLA
jgi:hypothetical protein